MGAIAQLLLVTARGGIMVAALSVAMALTGCQPPPPTAPENTVDASRYDAFWLWAGVTPQPVLDTAKRIYILQGEVTKGDPTRLISLRATPPRLGLRETWLVVRVETLAWQPGIYATLLDQLAQWRRGGNNVVGVQIDFDARTAHLDSYAAFLRDLRRRLPRDCQLSITGLLDWSANGDPAQLQGLGTVVDEVVLQTYQARRTIPGYENYLRRLGTLTIPFRIGLVQGGSWTEPPELRNNPHFKGYVVFLLNPADWKDAGRVKLH
jgi:hypothetical protein